MHRHAKFDKLLDNVEQLPGLHAHLDAAREKILASTAFPKGLWHRMYTTRRDLTRGLLVSLARSHAGAVTTLAVPRENSTHALLTRAYAWCVASLTADDWG